MLRHSEQARAERAAMRAAGEQARAEKKQASRDAEAEAHAAFIRAAQERAEAEAWREMVREAEIVNTVLDLVGKTAPAVAAEPEAAPDPANVIPPSLAGYMLPDESVTDFRARMEPRLQVLLHRLVRGDNLSVDCLPLTDPERVELMNLFAANAVAGDWLRVEAG